MAEDNKEIFPIMLLRYWWDLRKQFKRSIPTSVTDTYLASVLNITPLSARKNALPALRLLGIINQDGTTGERARAWRDNAQYKPICQAIIKELYPQELLDAFPESSEDDRTSVAQWFAIRTGVGEQAAKRMTAFYLMLNEADPDKIAEPVKPKAEKPKTKPKVEPTVKEKDEKATITPKIRDDTVQELSAPSININIEIHISSDASTTQIDQIFASMAKHLNIRRKTADE